MTILHIKNMVCPRCVMAVKEILDSFGFAVQQVTLGTAMIADTLSNEEKEAVADRLHTMGFELIADPRLTLVENIRTATIAWARMPGARPKLSIFLQNKLLKDYSTMSKAFRENKGMTIERYGILQRIERVKELLCYSELSTSEIAWETGYSSPAHLSTQFKQITGMSPSQYRESAEEHPAADRRFLDEI
ncbi:MAG: helix-turn-helix domain-containing protein [Prevotella sp.]